MVKVIGSGLQNVMLTMVFDSYPVMEGSFSMSLSYKKNTYYLPKELHYKIFCEIGVRYTNF